jgi:hypothetical protein
MVRTATDMALFVCKEAKLAVSIHVFREGAGSILTFSIRLRLCCSLNSRTLKEALRTCGAFLIQPSTFSNAYKANGWLRTKRLHAERRLNCFRPWRHPQRKKQQKNQLLQKQTLLY